MSFTLPYSPATTYIQQVQQSTNKITIWRKELAHESLKLQQFYPFMGESTTSPIQLFKELQAQHGQTIYFSLMKRIAASSNRPWQGDIDTHGKEVTIKDTQEAITIKEWRLPIMSGRAERQLPSWDYDKETEFAIRRYMAEMKDLHIYEAAIGVTSNDGTSSAIFTGEPPTNIVYPEGCASLADITASHTLNVESAPRAAVIAETGWKDSNTQVWVGTPPMIGGQTVRGVFFIHPYAKHDLRYDDDRRFEGWLQNARERSEGNPIWSGIPDKFMVDDILYVTMRYPLADQMLYSTAPWASGDTSVPGTQVALNVFMTGQAVARAICMEDILDFEDWDGKQFKRIIGGSYEGITKTRFDRSSSNNKDFGVVVVPTAANHPND